MASDRAPLLRAPHGDDDLERLSGAPSFPADPAISSGSGSGSGGGGTGDVNNSRISSRGSSRSSDRKQLEQRNAEDDELTDEEAGQDEAAAAEAEEARDRDSQHLFSSSTAARSSSSSSSSSSTHCCAPSSEAAARRGAKTTAFVALAGVFLLLVGATVGARARPGRGRGHPSGGVDGEGKVAARLGDGLPLPQCYSAGAADPSFGAWRRCDGGAGECSPMGNATLEDWMPQMESRCSERWALEHEGDEIMPYWTWEASNCRLEEVDAESFCRVMEGRQGILFAGDSLTGQTVDALAAVLGAELLDHKKLYYDKFSACGGALKFSWYRNDYLDTRTTASGGFETVHCEVHDVSMSRCMVFADDSVLREYDTLVVNSGAHRRSGGIEAYGEMMTNSSASLAASMKRLHGDNAILVVRNTVPGHGDPDKENWNERTFAGPVDVDTANSIVAEGKPVWGWTHFPDKNKLLEAAFGAPSWALLDAYTPTLLRPDMHADGLHYCFPGPLDHWIALLHNILLVETAARA